MYWTLELASKLEDAPWPATKDELIDYANCSGLPEAVLENLQEIEEDDEVFESIEDIYPDYPSKEDFLFNKESIFITGLIYVFLPIIILLWLVSCGAKYIRNYPLVELK